MCNELMMISCGFRGASEAMLTAQPDLCTVRGHRPAGNGEGHAAPGTRIRGYKCQLPGVFFVVRCFCLVLLVILGSSG